MNKLLIFILALSLTACANSKKEAADKATLTGAGATFPLPYYHLAFKTYQDTTGISVTYGGIGSGGGIRSLKDKIVDFAGSDVPLSPLEVSEMPAKVLQIPSCMGAVVLAYHLPGVETLQLTGDLIAGIFLGKINRWDDPRLQAVNPGIKLPAQTIYPVYRSDGSGTTYVFSDYLSKISPDWQARIGCGKALQWPVGIAAKGNPGVAGCISQTPGAIGYIGSEYAFALQIPIARLKNRAGHFIPPSAQSISAAAASVQLMDSSALLTDSAAPDAYPISCLTWLLLYQEQAYDGRTEAQAKAVAHLLHWLTNPTAQEMTTRVHYAPLPPAVAAHTKALLKTITYKGIPVL